MTYYDISLPIKDKMLSWPSDPEVRLKAAKTMAKGGSRVTLLSMGNHTGTHFDAPSHVLKRGKGMEAYGFETLIGPCDVVDLTGMDGLDIDVPQLERQVPEGAERVLFKTANTAKKLLTKKFTEKYVALTGNGAAWLAAAGVQLVGVDYLSINRRGGDGRGHTELLKRNIPIIEGLWLVDVPAGRYELIALPIRIEKGDGAPARVLLRRND